MYQLDAVGILGIRLSKFLHVDGNAVLNWFPRSFLDQRNQSDRNVGNHEQREREHVENLLARWCMNVIPFGKGSQCAKHKHEQREVEQAEENRRQR